MSLLANIWGSTLGKKYLMALTGIALFGFVIGHLLGNLQVFAGPDLINRYAHFLKSKPLLLWAVRLSLLAIVSVHIVTAISLTRLNRAARPIAYEGVNAAYGSTLASRTMLISGLVILAFVIYHLLHFTALLPAVNGTGIDFSTLETTLPGTGRTSDVYAMMIAGFGVWWVVLFYLVAQALLFLHLRHGIASLFASLGLRNAWGPRIEGFARVASLVIFIGYASIPAAIFLGLGRGYLSNVVKASARPAAVAPGNP